MPSRSPFASSFFRAWRQQVPSRDLARRFGLPVRTVQRLLARFARDGEAAVRPDYHRCGQDQPARTAARLVRDICRTRREHPRWGSELIRLELAGRNESQPSARTVRRHLRKAGLQPAPAGRPSAADQPLVPRAEQPHQGWQTDAAEALRLRGGRAVCWLRVVDECTGAFLQTVVFPQTRWERVSRHAIQSALRAAFARWGLPGRLRVDNGYPWGSTGEFAPELALWLIGLGVEVVWIPPARPQHNGVVERAQGTGRAWAEPQTCRTPVELQRRCDALDRTQREDYPYREGQSRWQVFPQLAHSGRAYRPGREAAAWDVTRVWLAIAGQVVRRRVDQSGSVSLYNRTRYVGKPAIGQVVYVSLDPTGPTWVFADAAGRELRTHPADELTAERIRGLTVTGRKSRDLGE